MPYNFSRPLEDIDLVGEGQPYVINNRIFKNRIKNGFFIEAGAFDGEHASNSLYYEIVHAWKGLLVEPNPDAYQDMIVKVKIDLREDFILLFYSYSPCIMKLDK